VRYHWVPEALEFFNVCVRVSHFWRSEEWHELFTSPLLWLGRKKGRMREEERKKRGEGWKWEAGKLEKARKKRHRKKQIVGFAL